MTTTDPPFVRKKLLGQAGSPGAPLPANEIDLAAGATILYSSEDPRYPIEQLLDGRSGRGATRWSSGRENTTEEIVLEFDRPQRIARVIFDAEELLVERTQQITLEFSSDGGKAYRKVFVQEYTFSPHGSTYQHEDLSVDLREVTHVRLIVVPNKGGSGTASLTSIRLFG
jgi:allantoicase